MTVNRQCCNFNSKRLVLAGLLGTIIVLLFYTYSRNQSTIIFRQQNRLDDEMMVAESDTATEQSHIDEESCRSLDDCRSYFVHKDLYNLTEKDQRRFFAWKESQVRQLRSSLKDDS
jgi:hypothetical protein